MTDPRQDAAGRASDIAGTGAIVKWTACLLLAGVAACTEPTPTAAPSPGEATAESPSMNAGLPTTVNQSATADQPAPPPPAAAREDYVARGQEPGWLLKVADGWIDYQGNYGETKIRVPAPAPRTSANGLRYETERLTIEVTHSRCNDAMSGHGYADQVKIIADGEAYDGCGGERRADWDV